MMKRFSDKLIYIFPLLMLLLLFFPSEDSETKEPGFDVYFKINSDRNWFSDQYDIQIDLDGEELCTLGNGDKFAERIDVSEGEHTLLFTNTDDPSINAETTLSVDKDMTFLCDIEHKDEIILKGIEIIDGIETYWEDEEAEDGTIFDLFSDEEY